MTIIYVLLVGHFVADFLCQSDWMAINKSKRWDALVWHVVTYGSVLLGFVSWAEWIERGFPSLPPESDAFVDAVLMFVGVNALAHFVQDAITSRITARWFFFRHEPGIFTRTGQLVAGCVSTTDNVWLPITGNRHWFFVAIGFDQLLHYVTLFVTAGWWLQ